MYLHELCVYEINEDGDPELMQMIIRDTKERCMNLLHKVKGSLKANEYFEIYCDETMETYYFLNDGTEVKTFPQLIKALNIEA